MSADTVQAVSGPLAPITSAAAIEEVMAHLGAAVMQMAPSDDQIICGHVRSAHEITKLLWRAQR